MKRSYFEKQRLVRIKTDEQTLFSSQKDNPRRSACALMIFLR